MKAVFSLLALAAAAVAQELVPKWLSTEETTTTTLTTFTTVTTCPVTSTTVEVSVFVAWTSGSNLVKLRHV
jgi:hypothetical protein